MAFKIEIIQQSLVITNTGTSAVILDIPKSSCYYDKDALDNDIIDLFPVEDGSSVEAALRTLPEIAMANAVDSLSVAFNTATFRTFARTNLGFKTASGGSGAVDSVNSKTGVVTLNTDEIPETATKVYVTPEEKSSWNVLDAGLLTNSSTITVSRNSQITDADGMNNSTSGTNLTITVLSDANQIIADGVAFDIGTVLQYKRSGAGNVIIAGDGITTKQTYALDDVLTIRKTATDTWEYLNPAKDTSGTNTGDQAPSSGTGTVIPLNNPLGYYGDMTTANTATIYTTTGTTLGAFAVMRINALTQPTVDGSSTPLPGATFAASTDMHMVIQYFGVTVQFYFIAL
jgi:hypothetical protein